jgi:type IV secretory pathway ATPase VirB11/archaellum biosynthesis ATPase
VSGAGAATPDPSAIAAGLAGLAGLPLFAADAPAPGAVRVRPASRPSVSPEAVPVAPTLPASPAYSAVAADLDWSAVSLLRVKASDRLTTVMSQRGAPLAPQAQRELGRAIIVDLLDAQVREDLTLGRRPLDPAGQRRVAQAVYDALFGLGRLQPLVDDERVENIEVNGFDRVTLQFADGTRSAGPPVAESDQELVDFLAFIASRSQGNPRPFSPASPSLHMTLDGGARLAATAWITPRPVVVIRRHRLRRVTLADLAARGMLSPLAASFLAAAIRARRSVVVSGPQGAGKTTLVRALAEELPPWERIGTFETEYELFLHEIPERAGAVAAWEARPGSGERGPDGRQAGEITLDDCLYDSFRFNLDRQIVGEVRGREVLAMFKAMQSGAGSISTTHAADAAGAIQKLVTCALEAGPQVTVAYAERVVAEHVDLIVQLDLDVVAGAGAPAVRHRYVSEIIAVQPGESGPAHTHVFRAATTPQGPRAVPAVLPDEYRTLAGHGFDLVGYTQLTTARAVPR